MVSLKMAQEDMDVSQLVESPSATVHGVCWGAVALLYHTIFSSPI